jgi:hypothetical protein
MNTTSYQSIYRNLPRVFGGLLGSIALLFVGITSTLLLVPRDQRFLLALGSLSAFVLVFAVCGMSALRRHRWTIDPDAVLIEEQPLVPMTGRRRVRRVPFDEIANLDKVWDGAEKLLALMTRDGERFVLPTVRTRRDRRGAGPDDEGLAAFAARLQAAMTAAGGVAPPVIDGLGFWNRPPGLALLGVAFLVSLAIAAGILWALWHGAILRVRTHEAAALLVALPILIGWLLHRSWRRRRSVMSTTVSAASSVRQP